ncbi:pyruvate kinase [Gryllotalpicola ginsengisoli]|uniref:pyruvate kinase n=1 Tax=Gryllotalpicola ginsengisoli TaxID=444608 RepID=UPI0003B6D5FA|nr:pyruvate kinase [Gryllotalpicola ginsengisoli]
MPASPDGLARDVLRELRALKKDIVAAEKSAADEIAAVDPAHRADARNLVRYVAFRRHDLRELQGRLASLGLSSLGRGEASILESIDAVIRLLSAARSGGRPAAHPSVPDAEQVLAQNAERLLGPPRADHGGRIMVTADTAMADDPALVAELVEAGMDIARVNCAHDGPEVWAATIRNARRAGQEADVPVRIAMDLAGPKLRTGPIEPGPQVVKVKPERDALGRVVEPARFWLGRAEPDTRAPLLAEVPAEPGDWFRRRRVGDEVRFEDARGRHRLAHVERIHEGGCLLALDRTAYLVPGTALSVEADGAADEAVVGELPPTPQHLLVQEGDTIVLTRELTPASPGTEGTHRIGCTLPEVFDGAQPGHRVLFDDGKIGGVVDAVGDGELTVRVTFAKPGGAKLRSEKGVNFPDTVLDVSALTDQDVEDLRFVVANAAIVELSFVRSAADVERLLHALDELEASADLGVVLKIETVAGFAAMPQILLSAMRRRNVGVMIARGDLAVEAGFARLAELQEELLWLCEAARLPVIWATEVLDTLAKKGVPSRSEITDAAAGERAECVMLNKGPYIVRAVGVLHDIVSRMNAHQSKKRSLLRALGSWQL